MTFSRRMVSTENILCRRLATAKRTNSYLSAQQHTHLGGGVAEYILAYCLFWRDLQAGCFDMLRKT